MNAQERMQALEWFERYKPMACRLVYRWAAAKQMWVHHGADLKQEGLIGLWEACQRISPDMQPKQRTLYIRRIVLGRMLDSIRNYNGTVHAPRSVKAEDRPRAYRFSAIEAALRSMDPRSHSPQVDSIITSLARTDPELDSEHEDRFWALCWCLPYDHAQALWLYHVEGWPLHRIGRELGLSETRVSQLFKQAYATLRASRRVRRAAGAA